MSIGSGSVATIDVCYGALTPTCIFASPRARAVTHVLRSSLIPRVLRLNYTAISRSFYNHAGEIHFEIFGFAYQLGSIVTESSRLVATQSLLQVR